MKLILWSLLAAGIVLLTLLTFFPSALTSPVSTATIAVCALLAVGGLVVLIRTARKG